MRKILSAALASVLLLGAAGAAWADAAHTLVLLRHGESEWNLQKRFTGWSDVALTEKGREGAKKAGEELREAGIRPDEVHTSMLGRAITTSWLALEGMNAVWVPVGKYWRLNERSYGDLEGKTRKEVEESAGKDQVKIWRRSFDVPPPPLAKTDPRSPVNDVRYKNLDPKLIPESESLKNVISRVGPYWEKTLLPEIKAGKTVMVVGHSTCLRALSKWIDPSLDEKALQKLEIANSKPIVYELDENMNIISRRTLGEKDQKKTD